MPENSQRRYSSLEGKVALVTGSAKRLGRAVALRLAEEGADLVIHHRASHGGAGNGGGNRETWAAGDGCFCGFAERNEIREIVNGDTEDI